MVVWNFISYYFTTFSLTEKTHDYCSEDEFLLLGKIYIYISGLFFLVGSSEIQSLFLISRTLFFELQNTFNKVYHYIQALC